MQNRKRTKTFLHVPESNHRPGDEINSIYTTVSGESTNSSHQKAEKKQMFLNC